MKKEKAVRVPWRVMSHLEGTGWWQMGEWDRTQEGDALAASVKQAVLRGRRNADHSITIHPTIQQVMFLRRQADYMYNAARDDAGWDADARADTNSARGLVRRLDAWPS